jgi:glucuronate isomerase
MFTSEPPLSQRIERMIGEAPIIDPRTRLRCEQAAAPDLASLLSDPGVQTELRSVGMPAVDGDPSLPGDERVRRALPYLRRMRNTTTAWCLYRIFRDLYDLDAPHVTESDARDLIDRVARTGRDPAWAPHILRDRCNIRTVVTGLSNRGADPSRSPEDVRFMLDLHDLFCPGVANDPAPFLDGRTTLGEYYEALCTLFGERPDTTERLSRLLRDWLDRAVTGPVRFCSTFLPIERRFLPPDVSHTRSVLSQAADGQDLADADVDALVRFVTWEVLGWHHDHRKALQIAAGVESVDGDGGGIPRFQQDWTGAMARAFHTFGNARFDLLMATDVLSQGTTALARQFPNVYVSGYWWHNFSPETIRRLVALRVQMAPMTKIGGFLCDADYAEWTYGRFQVLKKAMATALAGLVEAGYYEEDEIPPMLQQILHDTPRDLYDLGPGPRP